MSYSKENENPNEDTNNKFGQIFFKNQMTMRANHDICLASISDLRISLSLSKSGDVKLFPFEVVGRRTK